LIDKGKTSLMTSCLKSGKSALSLLIDSAGRDPAPAAHSSNPKAAFVRPVAASERTLIP
jgi:hypothetical protein